MYTIFFSCMIRGCTPTHSYEERKILSEEGLDALRAADQGACKFVDFCFSGEDYFHKLFFLIYRAKKFRKSKVEWTCGGGGGGGLEKETVGGGWGGSARGTGPSCDFWLSRTDDLRLEGNTLPEVIAVGAAAIMGWCLEF